MKYTGIAVVLAVVVAGAGGVFLFSSSHQQESQGALFGAIAAFGGGATSTPSSGAAAAAAPTQGGGRYTITPYGTTFSYPTGWQAKQVKNGTRTVVTVTPRTNQGSEGVQVAITPIGASMPVLTPQRIHQDLPNLDIEHATHITVDGQDILLFISNNASYGGEEGWFVHSGALYQVSAMPASKSAFATIVSSLHF